MMTSALILACITRQGGAILSGLLGLTAGERFHALHNLDNGNVAKNSWVTTVMLLVLAGSIIALVIVTLYRKLHAGRRHKAENRGQKTNFTAEHAENAEGNLIKKISANSVASAVSASGIEQRVSNIEKQVSAIEQRLTNIEQEVSSFEVIEADSTGLTSSPQASSLQDDSNAETQVLATINPGGSISEETK
jgi:hypothetical protein